MGKKKCKIKKTISTIWKENMGPFLTIVWEWIAKGLKFGGKLAVRLIGLAVFGTVIIIPFLHNCIDHTLAQWLWYPAGVGYIVFTVWDFCTKKEPTFKTPVFEYFNKAGSLMLLPFMASVFVLNYYDIKQVWLWVIFGMIAIATPIFFFSFYLFDIKQNNRTEEQRKNGAVNIFKYILLYWLYDLFYMAIFNQWLVLTYMFGIIAVVVIFYNLTKTFLNGAKTLQMFLPFDLLFGIGLSVYLIYIIPEDNLRNVILTVTASVIGGLLTLVGVAWTIKDSNDKRKEDLQRIEHERREEERKKHIPYIKVTSDTITDYYSDAYIRNGLDLSNPSHRSKLNNNVFYSTQIYDFAIKNVSFANIIIKGVIIDAKTYWLKNGMLLEPNLTCKIITTGNWEILLANNINYFGIIVDDIFENSYVVECFFENKIDTNVGPITATMDDGVEFTGFKHNYLLKSVALPQLID